MNKQKNLIEWILKEHTGNVYNSPSLEGFNTERSGLNDRFANEDGQNRKDAIDNKLKPVIVKIQEKFINNNENFYKKFIEGLEQNLEFTKNRKYKSNKKKNKNFNY